METKVQVPAGVEGDFHPDCRECRAGYAQAFHATMGFRCLDHGLMAYHPASARATDAGRLAEENAALSRQRDALLKACEAALRLTDRVRNILPAIGVGSVITLDAGRRIEKAVEEVEAAIQLAREGQ